MTVKIARMQSGEDVIADIKEARESPTATKALAYDFVDAFTITISAPEFEEDQLKALQDMKLQFFPWSPLTKGRALVTLYSVVAVSDPHDNVMQGYHEVLEKYKNMKKDDAKIDYSQTPPTDLSVGEDSGAGRGSSSLLIEDCFSITPEGELQAYPLHTDQRYVFLTSDDVMSIMDPVSTIIKQYKAVNE